MGREDYSKALKAGRRDYQTRMFRGEKPTLQVLDDILPEKGSYSEVPLGLVQIPIEQIVGTRTAGRSNSFAGNFMPILKEDTEFASKWANLSSIHVDEGIRDPIKAYEYMNKFYVEEGNKRVSVMKYFGVVSIPGNVTRIVPKRTGEKENNIYYEFLDFYQTAPINYIWFSQEGSFAKLQETVGKAAGEMWTDEDLLEFSSIYTRFHAEFAANGGGKLRITPGDAFLAFITLYGYDTVTEKTTDELRTLIVKSWEEFVLLQEDQEIELKMKPNQEKKGLLRILLQSGSPKLKTAFIYEKTPGTSAWTYGHELGRLYLEQTFPDELNSVCYENATQDNAEELIEDAIKLGCNLIFTTTPAFVQASVKAAISHPEVRILNCSLNTSHRYIRTYYSRMHEAKFLMGAIAAAMAVLYPAGVALGCHPGLLAGIIISGAIFGDNLAPVSDTTICSATSQGVDVPGVVRSRLKYAAVSAGATIVIAVILSLVLGSNGIAMDANLSYDPMAFFMLIAVVITIVVAIKTGDIIIATTLGTVSGGVIGVLTGQFDFLQIDAADPAKGALIAVHGEGLDRTVDGILQTGLSSMLQVCILALLLFGSIAIMRAGGGDVRLLNALGSVAKTAKGAEVVTSFMVIILSTIMGLNAPAILAVGPSFAKPLSEKHGISPYRTANLLDAQSNTLVYAMPWVPGMIYTLSFASGTSAPLTAAQVTPFVIYGYVLLVVMFASIFLGIGRHDGEDRLAAKAR